MRPFHLLLVSTGLTGVVVLGALVVTEPSGAPDAAPSTAQANGPVAAPDRAAASAARVLRTWDRARAAAWAAGDAAALRGLYRPDSTAGRADVAMLRAWTGRGLRVQGLTTQLLAVSVVEESRSRWLLRVEDRVTTAVAVGEGVRHDLPPHRPRVSVIELVADGGAWRVGSVRPARS